MIFLFALFFLTLACSLMLFCLKAYVAQWRKKALQQQLFSIRLSSGLKMLLVNIQQHRGMVMTYLKGDTSFKDKIMNLQQEIERIFGSMERLSDQNSTYRDELNRIEDEWRDLQRDVFALSSSRGFKEHSRLIERILNFLTHVAEQNQLRADNSYAVEYVNIIWQLIPITAEALGKARAVGSGIAAASESKALDRIQLGFLINKIRNAMQRVEFQITTVSEIGNELRQHFNQIHYDLNQLISLMETQLLSKEKTSVKAGDFFDQVTNLLNKIYALYDNGEVLVVRFLESDIAKAEGSAKVTMGSALISSLLVSVSAYFIF
ncbi:MAG: nitrate- and nitrite sensing domain-containing protein [Gammaproteobacteria bacterium]